MKLTISHSIYIYLNIGEKLYITNCVTILENIYIVLNITSPCLLKMTFRKNELVNLEQIKYISKIILFTYLFYNKKMI